MSYQQEDRQPHRWAERKFCQANRIGIVHEPRGWDEIGMALYELYDSGSFEKRIVTEEELIAQIEQIQRTAHNGTDRQRQISFQPKQIIPGSGHS